MYDSVFKSCIRLVVFTGDARIFESFENDTELLLNLKDLSKSMMWMSYFDSGGPF